MAIQLLKWFKTLFFGKSKTNEQMSKEKSHAHRIVIDLAKAPTCTELGLTEGSHCAVCGAILKVQEEIPATGHTAIADEAKAPTCIESGLTEGSHCAVCGTILIAQEEIPATGHTVIADEAKAPTCTEPGLTEGSHCAVCGAILKAQEEIPATGHTVIADEAKAPTCTESGLTEGSHCAVCGAILKAQEEIPATGHTVITDEAKAPTCTEPGLTKGSHCAVCGLVFVAQKEIPVVKHQLEHDEEVKPTYERAGLTRGFHCKKCGTVIIPQMIIPALSKEETKETDNTGLNDKNEKEFPPDHSIEDADGNEFAAELTSERNMSDRPHEHIAVIDKAIPPTCTKMGWTEGSHCELCGAILKRQTPVLATGHKLVVEEEKAPTCTESGYTKGLYCAFCEAVFKERKEIPATGHRIVFDKGRLPTCTETGLTEGTHCAVCGEVLKEQEEIPAKGHTMVIDAAKVPTETEAGFTEGSHCSVCGRIFVFPVKIPALSDDTSMTMKGEKCKCSGDHNEVVIDESSLFINPKTSAKHVIKESFKNRYDISGVVFPNDITHIDEGAFEGCTNLLQVIVPNSVRVIGDRAFRNCSALKRIVLPKHLKEIPKSCFENCSSLKTVIVGPELTTIKKDAFQGCTSLRQLAVPSSCWYISPNAFSPRQERMVTLFVQPGSFAEVFAEKNLFHYRNIALYDASEEVNPEEHDLEEIDKSGVAWTDESNDETSELTAPSDLNGEISNVEITEETAPIDLNGEISDVEISEETAPNNLNEEACIDTISEAQGSAITTEEMNESDHENLVDEQVVPKQTEEDQVAPGPIPENDVAVESGEVSNSQPVDETVDHPEQISLAERLKQLTSAPASLWPLGRMLAFGANMEEYERIKVKFIDQIWSKLDVLGTDRCAEEDLLWLTRLNQRAWQRAIRLCDAISQVSKDHKTGENIAIKRMMALSDDQISREMGLSLKQLRHEYKSYTNAVTDLFRQHERAFDFMYKNGLYDREIAIAFFGSVTLKRIEHCCDMNKLHEIRSEKAERPIGLQASLKQEASNRRTKVLNDWEHLKIYLEEQFDSQPILGSIELNDSEYELLCRYMQRQYQLKSIVNREMGIDKIICVALVQIAVRCPGAAYWPVVAEILSCSNTPDMMRMLGMCFLNTMKRYKKATFATSEYVASIKLHAFVSNAYIGRLFDFLFDYYELDLGRNMELANLEELRDLMISGDHFSRKQMILQQTLDALKLIPEASLARLKTYLNWIDEAFWHQGWTPEHEDRFSRAFKEWREGKPEFNGQWSSNAGAGRRGKRMFSQPTLYLDTRHGEISIILPTQRLPFDCADTTFWRVSSGDHYSLDITSELVESITGWRTEEKAYELPVDLLFEPLQMDFYNGDEIVKSYKIGSDCVRAFNAHGAMISGKRIPAGDVYFVTESDRMVETVDAGTQQRFGPWLLRLVTLQRGETVIFPDDSLAIVGSDATEGLCGGHPVEGACVLSESKDTAYPIFCDMPSFLIKVTEEQFQMTRFQLNDSFFAANHVNYRRLALNERGTDYGYLVTLPPPDDAVTRCHVNINVPGDNHVRDWMFYYWKDFHCEFDNGEDGLPYWDTPRGSVKLKLSIPFTGTDLKRDPSGSEYGFELKADNGKLDLHFATTGDNCVLRLDIPMITWRDASDWRLTPLGEVWHREFPDRIEIHTLANEIWMYVDRDGMKNGQSVCYRRRNGQDTIECDLLALRQWFTRDTIMHKVYLSVQGRELEFASVYCKSYLASGRLEADYGANTLHGIFDIIGKGNYSASVFHEQEEVLSQVAIQQGEFIAQAPLKSGTYDVIIFEEIDDEFGFEAVYDEIGRENIKLLNPADLTGARFSIRQVDTLNGVADNLGLRNKAYQITVTDRDQSDEISYSGIMNDTSSLEELVLPVKVVYPDPASIDHCSILFEEDGEWQPFLYDYGQKRIVRKENRKVPYMERYRRYVSLIPEDTCTVVYENT